MSKTDRPGEKFERIVSAIQQMFDPRSTVKHNQFLIDRLGNRRQCDVVIEGWFGGRPALGIIECKDHNRRKGPDAIEGFAKKTEHLRANLRLVASRRGFTRQALVVAAHENIGCVSLLPRDDQRVGFKVGDVWYAERRRWENMRLHIDFSGPQRPAAFGSDSVKWEGKSVIHYFDREFHTTHQTVAEPGQLVASVVFDQIRDIEVEGVCYPVAAIHCSADRVVERFRRWVSWSGDAFYNWNTGQVEWPPNGMLVGSEIDMNLANWEPYRGEIPVLAVKDGFGMQFKMILQRNWTPERDSMVPDLASP